MKEILLTTIITFFLTIPLLARNQGTTGIKAIVKPEKGTIGQVFEYRINIAGKGLGEIEILLPEKREFYPDDIPEKAGKDNIQAQVKKVMRKKRSGEQGDKEDPAKNVPLFIIHNARKDDRSTKEMTDITVVLHMTFYRPGKYALPEILIRDASKVRIGYKLPVVEIEGLNKKGEFQEIEPPLELGGNYTRLILLIVGVIVITAVTVFLIMYIRRKREQKRNAPVVVPPIDIFMKDIKKLNGKKLISDNNIDDYVFGISMIFRKYISSLLGIDATEMTTDEIENMLKKLSKRDNFKQYERDIMQSFHLWDLSKFAEFEPSEEILYQNLESTIRLAKKLTEDMDHDPDRV